MLSVKDIEEYLESLPPSDIKLLQNYFGMNDQMSYQECIHELSKKYYTCVQKNKKSAKMNSNQENNIPAGMTRLEWVQEQQRRWREQAVQLSEQENEMEVDTIPQAEKCNNDVDYFTYEKWDLENGAIPNVQIKLIDTISDLQKDKYLCFENIDFIKAMKSNIVAQWVNEYARTDKLVELAPNTKFEMDNEGYGGTNSIVRTFYKFPTLPAYLVPNEAIVPFKTRTIAYYNAIRVARKLRVGNMEGAFYVSGVHGQSPGYDIYYLSNVLDTNYMALREHIRIEMEDTPLYTLRMELNANHPNLLKNIFNISNEQVNENMYMYYVMRYASLEELMIISNIIYHQTTLPDIMAMNERTQQYTEYLESEVQTTRRRDSNRQLLMTPSPVSNTSEASSSSSRGEVRRQLFNSPAEVSMEQTNEEESSVEIREIPNRTYLPIRYFNWTIEHIELLVEETRYLSEYISGNNILLDDEQQTGLLYIIIYALYKTNPRRRMDYYRKMKERFPNMEFWDSVDDNVTEFLNDPENVISDYNIYPVFIEKFTIMCAYFLVNDMYIQEGNVAERYQKYYTSIGVQNNMLREIIMEFLGINGTILNEDDDTEFSTFKEWNMDFIEQIAIRKTPNDVPFEE